MTTTDFLKANEFLFERVKMGIDLHPSDNDLKQFQAIAKEIGPERHFTIYGCQSCIVVLVRFVYENLSVIAPFAPVADIPPEGVRMTFPKSKNTIPHVPKKDRIR